MRKMLVLIAVLVLAGGLALADSVDVGDQIKVQRIGGTTTGGLFLVTVKDGVTNKETQFQSFCLERNETIIVSTWYPIHSVGSDVWMGGVAGGSPDPIDAKTAWLYLQFRQGTLTGYTGDDLSIDGLQVAIWLLEHELGSVSNAAILAKANAFIALANAASADDLNAALAQVVAVNPYVLTTTGAPSHRQSVLAIVSVPEPATLVLLGAGLIGAGLIRRRC